MTTINSNTHAISINPATGEQIGHYPFESAAAQDVTLSRAAAGFAGWKRKPVQERAQLIVAMGKALRDGAETIARMISEEMGKPIAQARGEVEKLRAVVRLVRSTGPADADGRIDSGRG